MPTGQPNTGYGRPKGQLDFCTKRSPGSRSRLMVTGKAEVRMTFSSSVNLEDKPMRHSVSTGTGLSSRKEHSLCGKRTGPTGGGQSQAL